jgi:hypothetical protein
MQAERPVSPELINMIQRTLGAPLEPGQLGVVLAQVGVGKTACLTHIALEELYRGDAVLHVCMGETPDKIKLWYKEFLKNLAEARQGEDAARLQQRIEPRRLILSFLHQALNPEKLEQSLNNLKEQAKFSPAMMVLDGLDFDRADRALIEQLRDLAQKHQVSVWMSARTHRHISEVNERGIPYPCHQMDDLFNTIMLLEPTPDAIQVKVLKQAEHYRPEHPQVLLNSQTYLLL